MAKKKMESTFLNMFFVLLAIALVSSFALGYTYSLTKPGIEKAKKAKQERAIKKVLPEYDSIKETTSKKDKNIVFFMGYKNGKLVGTAVKTYSDKGFSGRIWLIVGFDNKGNILNIEVLSHNETPGLGSKMTTDSFRAQFKGKNPANFILKVKKDGGDVDAITAATISSRAFCDAVRRAYDALKGGK